MWLVRVCWLGIDSEMSRTAGSHMDVDGSSIEKGKGWEGHGKRRKKPTSHRVRDSIA